MHFYRCSFIFSQQDELKPRMHVHVTRFSEHKWKKSVCMQFLMVVISEMAHKVDLRLAERQISQSLNSRMLHQEYIVCASFE